MQRTTNDDASQSVARSSALAFLTWWEGTLSSREIARCGLRMVVVLLARWLYLKGVQVSQIPGGEGGGVVLTSPEDAEEKKKSRALENSTSIGKYFKDNILGYYLSFLVDQFRNGLSPD